MIVTKSKEIKTLIVANIHVGYSVKLFIKNINKLIYDFIISTKADNILFQQYLNVIKYCVKQLSNKSHNLIKAISNNIFHIIVNIILFLTNFNLFGN
jgi:hypothetical protein